MEDIEKVIILLDTGLYSDDNLESGLSMGVSKKKEINHTLSLEVKWDGYYFSDQETV